MIPYQNDDCEVKVGICWTQIPNLQVSAQVKNNDEKNNDRLYVGHLVDGATEESNFLTIEWSRFGTDQTKATRPDPEIDILPFSYVT